MTASRTKTNMLQQHASGHASGMDSAADSGIGTAHDTGTSSENCSRSNSGSGPSTDAQTGSSHADISTQHLTVQNISVSYPLADSPALFGITISISKGDMVGLLGPNGSGKTTLLHTLSGVLAPREGTVTLSDSAANVSAGSNTTHCHNLFSMAPKERARRIASVPQRMPDPPQLTAEAMVLMGRYPHISFWGGYTEHDKAIAREAMQATSTAHLAERSATALSGGEFQRVLIARALAQQTDTLLLDEATSGLDIARKMEIYDMLAARNAAQGTTVISAIHDLNLAALYCRRLIFLKQGRIVLDGSVDQVFTDSALSEVYETPVTVFPHPVTGTPQACFVPFYGIQQSNVQNVQAAPAQQADVNAHRAQKTGSENTDAVAKTCNNDEGHHDG